MAEVIGDKYVKCIRCSTKFENDDEHIENDFGYNKLSERYKTCLNCRIGKRESNLLSQHKYLAANPEKERERSKIYRETNKEKIK